MRSNNENKKPDYVEIPTMPWKELIISSLPFIVFIISAGYAIKEKNILLFVSALIYLCLLLYYLFSLSSLPIEIRENHNNNKVDTDEYH